VESFTSAVRSTNIKDPAWRARRPRIANKGGNGEAPFPFRLVAGFANKGSRAFERDCRVRGDTLASVRSPHAPARRLNPWRKITIETSNPPMGSRGIAGKNQVPKMAKKKRPNSNRRRFCDEWRSPEALDFFLHLQRLL